MARAHWWRLGRFSGGYSPIFTITGNRIGWALHLLRGKRLDVAIRWERRAS